MPTSTSFDAARPRWGCVPSDVALTPAGNLFRLGHVPNVFPRFTIAQQRGPVQNDALERRAGSARGGPAGCGASPGQYLPELLVSTLCFCPATRPQSTRRAGFDPGVFRPPSREKFAGRSRAEQGPVSVLSTGG